MQRPPIAWSVGSFEHEGERLAFEVSGSGPETIVFSHGLGGSHAVWFQQVPFFADRYRVITWDARGFGSSTDRGGRSGIGTSVGDLAAVLDHLEVDGAHVVGQSMGGWTSLGLALAQPHRVITLTLANSIAGVNLSAWHEYRNTTTSGPPPMLLGQHPALGTELCNHDPAKAFLYQQLGGAGYGGVGNAPAHVVQSLAATGWDDEAVGAYAGPVLLISGSDDALFPPSMVADVATRFRAATMTVIDGAGHSAYFERPSEWNATLNGFLSAGRVA